MTDLSLPTVLLNKTFKTQIFQTFITKNMFNTFSVLLSHQYRLKLSCKNNNNKEQRHEWHILHCLAEVSIFESQINTQLPPFLPPPHPPTTHTHIWGVHKHPPIHAHSQYERFFLKICFLFKCPELVVSLVFFQFFNGKKKKNQVFTAYSILLCTSLLSMTIKFLGTGKKKHSKEQ